MKLIHSWVFLTVLAVAGGAHAALVDNGNYVTDDVAHIDYYKLPLTAGMSWSQVVAGDALGLLAAGWIVTPQADLAALAASSEEAYNLINAGASALVASDAALTGGQSQLGVGMVYIDDWPAPLTYVANFALTPVDTAIAVSFARASIVPVPAAVYLFVSALMCLAGVKRFDSRNMT